MSSNASSSAAAVPFAFPSMANVSSNSLTFPRKQTCLMQRLESRVALPGHRCTIRHSCSSFCFGQCFNTIVAEADLLPCAGQGLFSTSDGDLYMHSEGNGVTDQNPGDDRRENDQDGANKQNYDGGNGDSGDRADEDYNAGSEKENERGSSGERGEAGDDDPNDEANNGNNHGPNDISGGNDDEDSPSEEKNSGSGCSETSETTVDEFDDEAHLDALKKYYQIGQWSSPLSRYEIPDPFHQRFGDYYSKCVRSTQARVLNKRGPIPSNEQLNCVHDWKTDIGEGSCDGCTEWLGTLAWKCSKCSSFTCPACSVGWHRAVKTRHGLLAKPPNEVMRPADIEWRLEEIRKLIKAAAITEWPLESKVGRLNRR